ncbi:polyketide synthase dehydratase domain-containing protein [Variovorax sp. NFACC27]
MLPGVAYLELARAAVVQALELAASQARDVRLEQVVFAQPVVVGNAPVEVHIALVPQDGGLVSFEVYTQVAGEEEARVHAQGRARVAVAADAPLEDLGRLRAQCPQVFASEACYAEFARMGLEYGPAFRVLAQVWVGQDAAGRPMALGDVQMPSQGTDPAAFVLPPSLLDGALQASIGLVFAQPQDRLSLPFAVEAVELYGVVPEKAVAVVRQSEGSMIGDAVLKLDVSLVDAEGRVCVQLRGFSSRVLDSVAGQAAAPAPAPAKGEVETLLLRPTWQEAQLPAAEPVSYGAHWVVLCEVGGDAEAALKAALPQARCLHLSAEGADLSTRYGGYAAQLLAYLQAMFSEKPSGWVRVQLVVPASGEGALLAGLGGMLKSARQESPKLVIQVLGVEPSLGGEALAQCVSAEAQAFEEDVRYRAATREVMRLEEVREDAEQAQALVPTPWKRGGVYLISGGAGGLGLIFGKAIATAVSDVTLVLTGRSVLGAEAAAAAAAGGAGRARGVPAGGRDGCRGGGRMCAGGGPGTRWAHGRDPHGRGAARQLPCEEDGERVACGARTEGGGSAGAGCGDARSAAGGVRQLLLGCGHAGERGPDGLRGGQRVPGCARGAACGCGAGGRVLGSHAVDGVAAVGRGRDAGGCGDAGSTVAQRRVGAAGDAGGAVGAGACAVAGGDASGDGALGRAGATVAGRGDCLVISPTAEAGSGTG